MAVAAPWIVEWGQRAPPAEFGDYKRPDVAFENVVVDRGETVAPPAVQFLDFSRLSAVKGARPSSLRSLSCLLRLRTSRKKPASVSSIRP